MPQYHIWTVGCQVNTADSAKLAQPVCDGWAWTRPISPATPT